MTRFSKLREKAEANPDKFPMECHLCSKHHALRLCPIFRAMTVIERMSEVVSQNYCQNCLAMTHAEDACTSLYSCRRCNRKHHTMLHIEEKDLFNVSSRNPIRNELDLVEIMRSRVPARREGQSGLERELFQRRQASEGRVLARPVPDRRVSARSAPERRVSARPAPERRVSARPAPERRVSVRPVPERRVSARPAPYSSRTGRVERDSPPSSTNLTPMARSTVHHLIDLLRQIVEN